MTDTLTPTAERLRVGPPPHSAALVDMAWRGQRLSRDAGLADAAAVRAGDARGPDALAKARQAAVLLLLVSDENGELAVVLTQRADHLKSHPGQVALPGGRLEPGEQAVAAALREAEEEVGLPAAHVLPLGVVNAYLTRTGFVVRPVIGVLRAPAVLRPDPSEVASVFTVPWRVLMDPAQQREVFVELPEGRRSYFEVLYGGRRIWGVTAGILRLIHDEVLAQ